MLVVSLARATFSNRLARRAFVRPTRRNPLLSLSLSLFLCKQVRLIRANSERAVLGTRNNNVNIGASKKMERDKKI